MKHAYMLLIGLACAAPASAQLQNGSFENAGQADLSHWVAACPGMTSVPSTAPNGGAWCMEMSSGNTQGCFPGQAIQVLPGITNGEMYTFAGWCRNVPSPFGPFIGLSLGRTNQGVVTPLGTAQWTSDTAWTYLSATDTFFLDVGDTAVVILSSGLVGGPAGPSAQFDAFTLTSSTAIREHERETLLLYPDPVVHTLYMATEANNTTFMIRDVRGSLVQQGRYDPRGIDVSKLPAGLYLIECDQRVARFLKQ